MKKIMFNDRYGLTEAVLSGRKTQTSGIIPNNILCACDFTDNPPMVEDSNGDWNDLIKASRYQVGEVVAVAQSYKDAGFDPNMLQTTTIKGVGVVDAPISTLPGWTNKMFTFPSMMPHQIRITNVRVERLQDISDEDCIKEGLVKCDDEICKTKCYLIPECRLFHCGNGCEDPREAYAALIDHIAGKGTWQSNPYVFVYDFELVK